MSERRRGAKAKQESVKRPGLIRRLCLMLVLVSALAWLTPMMVQEALVIWDRPVQEVTIEGPFKWVAREQIANLIGEQINTGFWALDIAALQHSIEQDAWVDRVSIRRKWPDRLVIEIEEQKPIARWGSTGYVNVRGELIESDAAMYQLSGLPTLVAAPENLEKMLQYYQTIAELMYARDLRLASIEVDARGSWTVSLADGVAIRFGRQSLQTRIRRFAKVFDVELRSHWANVSAVDVRYNNGIAVSWRDAG
ncbi:cell division protein FtsQ/DivIB [Simiduia agarivorans]